MGTSFSGNYGSHLGITVGAPIPHNSSNSIDLNNQFDNPDLEYLYGFQFNDPFWLTNPENLPFYLSSPSDDDMNNSSSVFKVGSSSSTGPTNTGSSSSIPSGSLVDEETMRKRMNQNSNIPIHDVSGSQTNPIFNIPEITNQTTNQYVSNWTSVSQQQFQLQQQPQQLQQQQQQVLIQQQDISQPQTQIQHESDTQRAPQEYQQGANTQSNQGRIFFNQSEYQVPQSMNYSTGLETFQQSASNQSKVEESVQRKQNDQTQ